MDFADYVLAVPLIGLQAILLFLLLRGPFRQYPILLIYCGVEFLTSVLEFNTNPTSGFASKAAYRWIYWSDEITLDLLLFLMVIVFTFRATEGSPLRPAVGKLLTAVVCAGIILPFIVLHRPLFTPRWFRGTSQLLNFGGAIMNLALWTALIGSKKRDSRLITVSMGLGLMVTGAAIAWGLRQWTTSAVMGRMLTNKFDFIVQIVGTAIWCWAFRRETRSASDPVAAVTNNV